MFQHWARIAKWLIHFLLDCCFTYLISFVLTTTTIHLSIYGCLCTANEFFSFILLFVYACLFMLQDFLFVCVFVLIHFCVRFHYFHWINVVNSAMTNRIAFQCKKNKFKFMPHIDGQWIKQWHLLLLHFVDKIGCGQFICYVNNCVCYVLPHKFP